MSRSALPGLLAAALLASPALAGKTAEPPKASAPSGAAAEERFAWRSTEPLTVAAVLAQFELFDRELKTLSARFTQSMSVQQTGMASAVEGELSFRKPDQLVIKHRKPEAQTVVSDGKDVWIHRLSQNQVIQSSLSDWRQADPMINNLMQFGSYSSMLKNYEVALDTAAGQPLLSLTPKARQSQAFELRLTLARGTLFPEASELHVGDMRIRTRFDELRLNPPLDGAMFRFSPPAGADVFRDFKPPKFQP